MSEKVKNWFYAAGEIISAVWTVVSLLLDINGYTTKYDLRVVAIFGVVIFVVLMLIHIISKNNQLESKTPNIQIDGRINKVERGKSIIANVPFANNPKNRTLYNNANGVLAKITYLDERKKPLFNWIRGRWTDTKFTQELEHGEAYKNESIDFPNNGGIRWLEVLIKQKGDEFCYGFNNTAARENNSWIYPPFEIKQKKFYIEVELFGNYINNNVWVFEVMNEGENGFFKIWKKGEKWQPETISQAKKEQAKTKKKKSSRKKV